MKSDNFKKLQRGFLERDYKTERKYTFSEKVNLLNSKIPRDRTLGARFLAHDKTEDSVSALIDALKSEKKLYTKLEICNSLVEIGELSIKPLISVLGEIGDNQHKSVPKKQFGKKNYPLPRDIAARTLIRFKKQALTELLIILKARGTNELSEAIDAIGYICFYNNTPEVFEKLRTCYYTNIENELIRWKIIRAMSAFRESYSFLVEQNKNPINKNLSLEFDRSIRLITNNLN